MKHHVLGSLEVRRRSANYHHSPERQQPSSTINFPLQFKLTFKRMETPEPKQLPERRFERNTKNINLNFAKLGIESEELLSNSIAYIDSEAFRFFLTTERSCCIFSALHMPFLALPRNETPSISIGTMNGPRFVNQHRIMSLDWESLLSITYQLLAAVPYESQALARLKKVNSSEMEEGKRGELNRSHSTARGFTFYSI